MLILNKHMNGAEVGFVAGLLWDISMDTLWCWAASKASTAANFFWPTCGEYLMDTASTLSPHRGRVLVGFRPEAFHCVKLWPKTWTAREFLRVWMCLFLPALWQPGHQKKILCLQFLHLLITDLYNLYHVHVIYQCLKCSHQRHLVLIIRRIRPIWQIFLRRRLKGMMVA